MSLFDDYREEMQFSKDFPFGIPCKEWTMKGGNKISVKDMTTKHIMNCMNLVGIDDPWYSYFEKELKLRSKRD